MKAITIQTPYAQWIAVGLKDETRIYGTSYRGPLAVHVSQTVNEEAMKRIGLPPGYGAVRAADDLGRVIAVVHLVDVRMMQASDVGRAKVSFESRWRLWVLREARAILGPQVRGRLGLFEIDDKLIHKAEAPVL